MVGSRIAAGLLAILMAGAGAASAAQDPARAAADGYTAAHQKAILAEFSDFLAMPNVATTQADVEANAAHLVGLLHQRGFQT